MMKKQIEQVLKKYDPKNIRIGVLGSHSALEIAAGAKQEGFETVVVCQKGRDKTYTKYYRSVFDHTMLLDNFNEITSEQLYQTVALACMQDMKILKKNSLYH